MARSPLNDEQYDGNDEQIADLKESLERTVRLLEEIRDGNADHATWPEVDAAIAEYYDGIHGDDPEAANVAREAGWYRTENGTWMAFDQDPDTGYPEVEYDTASQLCKEEKLDM